MALRKTVVEINNKIFECYCGIIKKFKPNRLNTQLRLKVERPLSSGWCRSYSSSVDLLKINQTSSRCFFTFPGSGASRRKEYKGRKLIGYSMEEMYSVVSDVENYKNFVPFCKRSHVTKRTNTYLRGDLVIGFPPLVESYVSHVTLQEPRLVKAHCTDGKLFDHLMTTWQFNPGLKNNKRSCVIDFYVDFKFKSILHSQLAHMFFNELVRQMESAFFAEAQRRYGKATVQTTKLSIANI